MITIDTQYAFKKYYTFGSLSAARWRYEIKNFIRDELKILLDECLNIDEILDVCKKKYIKGIPLNLLIYIKIDKNNYILNHELKLITIDDINRLKFAVFIKYDINNVRITTVEPIEKRLYYCSNLDEQIEMIKKYIEKPTRRFKKWDTKPNKIYLHYSYDEQAIEFDIKYED